MARTSNRRDFLARSAHAGAGIALGAVTFGTVTVATGRTLSAASPAAAISGAPAVAASTAPRFKISLAE